MSVMGSLGIGSTGQFTVDSTGNVGITKADPTLTLTDSVASNSAYLKKVDTLNEATLSNEVLYDAITSDIKLLLHLDGTEGSTTITDSSSAPKSPTVAGNAKLTTAQKEFGTASLTLDGTGDYVAVPSSTDWDLSNGDFTIDFWTRHPVTPTTLDTYFSVGAISNNAGNGLNLLINGANLQLYMSVGSVHTMMLSGAYAPTTNTWYHIAVVRNGSNFYLFVNGTIIDTGSSASSQDTTTYELRIGASRDSVANPAATRDMNVFIDEFRWAKGIATWTSNFTPSVSAYSSTTQVEAIGLSIKDGVTALDQGIVTLSNNDAKTVINGKSQVYQIGGTEKMRLDASGNLGIGTTTYPLKLDVAGSARFTGTATSVLTGTIDPAASTTVTGVSTLFTTELVIGDRITVTGETRTVTAIASNTSLTIDIAFTNGANDTAPDKLAAVLVNRISDGTVKMVMNDLGYVGIGTTSPLLPLEVNGSVRFTGSATSVLTGSIDPTASTTVTGVGTKFLTELVVGDRITVTAVTKTVTAIASDTSLTVDTAFTDLANDASPDKLAAVFIARTSAGTAKFIVNDLGDVYIPNLSTAGFVQNSASGLLSTVTSGNVLPKRGQMWGDEVTLITGTGISTAVTTSNQMYNMYANVTNFPIDNSAGWGFLCDAGTYTFDILHIKASSGGQVDFYIDGATIATAQETYNVSTLWNQHFTVSSVTLTAGYHTFKWVVPAKNASSSGYLFGVTKVSFKQTAD